MTSLMSFILSDCDKVNPKKHNDVTEKSNESTRLRRFSNKKFIVLRIIVETFSVGEVISRLIRQI